MTDSGVVIREGATAADVRECAELIAAEGSDDVEQWLQRFNEVLEDPDRRFLVAVVDDTVVAFGHLRYVDQSNRSTATTPSGWYLNGVTVAAPRRRQGIGHALTQERIRLLRGIADRVYYVAEPKNTATLAMDRQLGSSSLERCPSRTGINRCNSTSSTSASPDQRCACKGQVSASAATSATFRCMPAHVNTSASRPTRG